MPFSKGNFCHLVEAISITNKEISVLLEATSLM